MRTFFEQILREYPELSEEIERFRQWGARELFNRLDESLPLEIPHSIGDITRRLCNEVQQAMIRVGGLPKEVFPDGGVVPSIPQPNEAWELYSEYLLCQGDQLRVNYQNSFVLSDPLLEIEPQEIQEEPPSPINPLDCRFYSGTGLLRCAVNPCAKTCNGCNSFEPKQ